MMELEELKALAEKVRNETATQEEVNQYLEVVNGLLSELMDGVDTPSQESN